MVYLVITTYSADKQIYNDVFATTWFHVFYFHRNAPSCTFYFIDKHQVSRVILCTYPRSPNNTRRQDKNSDQENISTEYTYIINLTNLKLPPLLPLFIPLSQQSMPRSRCGPKRSISRDGFPGQRIAVGSIDIDSVPPPVWEDAARIGDAEEDDDGGDGNTCVEGCCQDCWEC